MKFISLLLIVFFATPYVFASTADDCKNLLTDNGTIYSTSKNYDIEEWEIKQYDNDDLASAIQVVRTMIRDYGCQRSDINFSKTPGGKGARSKCGYIVSGELQSLVCYVESNLGHFLVSWDFHTIAYVTYNRPD